MSSGKEVACSDVADRTSSPAMSIDQNDSKGENSIMIDCEDQSEDDIQEGKRKREEDFFDELIYINDPGQLNMGEIAYKFDQTIWKFVSMEDSNRSVDKLNGRQSCPAKIGSGGKIRSSRLDPLIKTRQKAAGRRG